MNMAQSIYKLAMETMVDVPEGTSGDWVVKRFEVSEKDANWANMRASISMGGVGAHRTITPGTYTSMTRHGTMVMSDTPAEKRDHLEFLREAHGRVLIAGLGLGWVLEVLQWKEEVTHITVVEISPDVIKLVGEHYKRKLGDRLTISEGGIFEWKTARGEKWDCAWFDIWDNICGDNAEEMSKLKRKFARRAKWKGCWCEYESRRANREANRMMRAWR
jgi:hypothetical protein